MPCPPRNMCCTSQKPLFDVDIMAMSFIFRHLMHLALEGLHASIWSGSPMQDLSFSCSLNFHDFCDSRFWWIGRSCKFPSQHGTARKQHVCKILTSQKYPQWWTYNNYGMWHLRVAQCSSCSSKELSNCNSHQTFVHLHCFDKVQDSGTGGTEKIVTPNSSSCNKKKSGFGVVPTKNLIVFTKLSQLFWNLAVRSPEQQKQLK